jgi:hypothetical protein
MTVEELKTLGIPLARYSEIDVLYVESALEWILENTTLVFDKSNPEEIKALPSGAKLFVVKYRELMNLPIGVTGESVDGLSQSFSDSLKKDRLLEYAYELMGGYMKSGVLFVPATNRWRVAPWV